MFAYWKAGSLPKPVTHWASCGKQMTFTGCASVLCAGVQVMVCGSGMPVWYRRNLAKPHPQSWPSLARINLYVSQIKMNRNWGFRKAGFFHLLIYYNTLFCASSEWCTGIKQNWPYKTKNSLKQIQHCCYYFWNSLFLLDFKHFQPKQKRNLKFMEHYALQGAKQAQYCFCICHGTHPHELYPQLKL